MGKPLPLYPGAKPCVRSGFCCTVAPCPFGTWDPIAHQCTELVWNADGTSGCRKYDAIIALPEAAWWAAPAFGAGCCMPLFNERREAILKKKEEDDDAAR